MIHCFYFFYCFTSINQTKMGNTPPPHFYKNKRTYAQTNVIPYVAYSTKTR